MHNASLVVPPGGKDRGSCDLEARDRLVEQHQPLVQRIAKQARTYAQSIGSATTDLDDLVGLAQEGMVRAAESFDAGKGVPFSYYAWTRVMGHIKDALRDDDFLTRRERQLVQAWLRGDVLEEHRAKQAARLASQRPEAVGAEAVDELPVDDHVEEAALAQLQVKEALRFLDPMERAVLSYRYLDGMSTSAIAALLRVTEARVSQVHRAALRRLRKTYELEAS